MTSISRNILWGAALSATALLPAGPASAAEKRYGLTSFEAIEVTADVAVEVVTRAPVSAVASGPQDALDRLSLESRDGKLVISQRQFAGDDKRGSPRGPVTVRVNAANLTSATLAGAGSLSIDQLKGQRAMVGLRGPGRLTVGRIAANESFRTYPQEGPWWRVRLANGTVGYVESASIRSRAQAQQAEARAAEARRRPTGPRINRRNSENMRLFCAGPGKGTPPCRVFQQRLRNR